MTTPNEELRKLAESAKPKPIGNMASQQEKSAHMTRHMDARMALARAMEPEHVITMCDFMQSQAERIKELEAEIDNIKAVEFPRRLDKVTKPIIAERDTLRAQLADAELHTKQVERGLDKATAQLAAIRAQEPALVVEKEPDYWSVGHFHEGSKPHIKPTKVWCLPIGTQLFTRPMPAQDVTELVEALEKLASLGNGDQYGNSDGNMIARDALAKFKGAK